MRMRQLKGRKGEWVRKLSLREHIERSEKCVRKIE